MPRKPSPVARAIAEEYRNWLLKNPNASRRLRILAFDQIADKHFKTEGAEKTAA